MIWQAKSGHPGGSLSAADIVTYLYFQEMRIDAARPAWPERDRFVLSKGHAAPLLYSALARRGYFDPAELLTLRQLGSRLQGHPHYGSLPGIETSTGSLGQGAAAAVGMALAGRLDRRDYRVFTLWGDGELEEGLVWETAMAAAHYRLDNLVGIVDWNGLQIDGPIREVMNPEPIDAKFAAFGWQVEQADGHDFASLSRAFERAKAVKGKPTLILCHTLKGKGVSYMEGQAGWHGKAPDDAQWRQALAELDGAGAELAGTGAELAGAGAELAGAGAKAGGAEKSKAGEGK
jgi:transketolase